MQLGVDNKKKVIWASALGGIAVLVAVYQFMPSSSSSPASSTIPTQVSTTSPNPPGPASKTSPTRSGTHRATGPAASDKDKKAHPQNLDPMLHLAQLAAAEQVKYEGSGRNIFVSQADSPIPIATSNGTTDHPKENPVYTPPTPPPPPPIPLKFFGFASGPGEPKRIFLSKGDDVFIVGEGEIVDRRYKVLHISPTSVEMQDVVGSGPPQSLPLVQG